MRYLQNMSPAHVNALEKDMIHRVPCDLKCHSQKNGVKVVKTEIR